MLITPPAWNIVKCSLWKPNILRRLVISIVVATSVATLLLRKCTRFHDKKNTRLTKANLHSVKMSRNCVAIPDIDIVQLIVNQK